MGFCTTPTWRKRVVCQAFSPPKQQSPQPPIPFNHQILGITAARLNYYTTNVYSAISIIEDLQTRCSDQHHAILDLRDQVQQRKWDVTDAKNIAKVAAAEGERRLDEAKQEGLDEINAPSVREREIRRSTRRA